MDKKINSSVIDVHGGIMEWVHVSKYESSPEVAHKTLIVVAPFHVLTV